MKLLIQGAVDIRFEGQTRVEQKALCEGLRDGVLEGIANTLEDHGFEVNTDADAENVLHVLIAS